MSSMTERDRQRDLRAAGVTSAIFLFAMVLVLGFVVGLVLALILVVLIAAAGVVLAVAIDQHLESRN